MIKKNREIDRVRERGAFCSTFILLQYLLTMHTHVFISDG